MTCGELDRVTTLFVDDVCSQEVRNAIVAHLRECSDCRTRVEAESTARRLLQAHAAASRTLGVPPPWHPRVFRLGRPLLPARPAAVFLAGLIGAGLISFYWFRPTAVTAVGVIGDSFCQHQHRFTTRFNVGEYECTLGCVSRGAEFVLVTNERVYRIRNQELPGLAELADARVRVQGTMDGDHILVDRLTRSDEGR